MNLRVGISAEQPHWKILLQQIGVPYSLIDFKSALTINNFAVIIVNSDLRRDSKNEVINFINKGGSLLTEAEYAKDLLDHKTKSVYIKYLNIDSEILGKKIPFTDIYKKCVIVKDANHFKNQDGSNTFYISKIGEGTVVVLPSGFIASILDINIIRKNFYSGFGNGFVSERVSKVSKGSIRYFLQTIIEYLFHVRELPFVNLWQFPDCAKNIFGFRIDTDFAHPEDVEDLYKTIRQNNIKATWFIETKSSEAWINKYASFQNQEIGLHCYQHKVFSSYKKNLLNLQSGLNALKKVDIKPFGIAAPYGEWNGSLGKAIENLGFRYSSEFSISYDNLPYNPFFNNSFSRTLQIPIHPMSFGRLYWAGYSNDDMLNYFLRIIEEKLYLCEPIFLYTHPGEKRFDILDKIFKRINQMNISSILFNQYAEWWIKRNQIKWKALLLDGEVKIKTDNKDKSFWVCIADPSGKNYIYPLIEDSHNHQKIEIPGFNYEKPIDLVALRKYSWRMFKDDILFQFRKLKQ